MGTAWAHARDLFDIAQPTSAYHAVHSVPQPHAGFGRGPRQCGRRCRLPAFTRRPLAWSIPPPDSCGVPLVTNHHGPTCTVRTSTCARQVPSSIEQPTHLAITSRSSTHATSSAASIAKPASAHCTRGSRPSRNSTNAGSMSLPSPSRTVTTSKSCC